jgi:hypothetical protein
VSYQSHGVTRATERAGEGMFRLTSARLRVETPLRCLGRPDHSWGLTPGGIVLKLPPGVTRPLRPAQSVRRQASLGSRPTLGCPHRGALAVRASSPSSISETLIPAIVLRFHVPSPPPQAPARVPIILGRCFNLKGGESYLANHITSGACWKCHTAPPTARDNIKHGRNDWCTLQYKA